jgi:hypothetical protein
MLSKFTKKNLKKFKKYKYDLSKDSYFMRYVYSEYDNIIYFMNNNSINANIDVKVESNLNNLNNKFNLFSRDSHYVINDIIQFNNNHPETIIVSYNDNHIYIKYNQFENIKNKLFLLIQIIEYLKYKVNSNKKFEIYLSLSDLIKYFPRNDNKTIDVENVNSGYTDHKKSIIYIWRYEEFEKVLIHEAIHYIKFFYHDYDNININHNIIGNDLHFEAITDFWAIIYHSIYVSLYLNKSIRKILEYELGFIRNQAMVMNEHFSKNNKQNTNAYSYYILKYRLFDYIIKNNLIISIDNINNHLLQNIVYNNFDKVKYENINSSRMTLFQLG